jgi:purine-binding chemotaxis protein CheW
MSRRHASKIGRHAVKSREDLKNLVRFQLGDTHYAFDVSNVEEVVQPGYITILPRMATSVAGVFDHRGRVTPIVDLRPRFGLTATDGGRHAKWILMRTDQGLVGFLVDRVLEVIGTVEALDDAPLVGPNTEERAIRGVVHLEKELLFVLDENRLASVVAQMDLPEDIG